MARINLTELLADREAGTDGPWAWNDVEGYYTLSPGIFISDSPDGTPWGDNIDGANARRIARLPDLEAAYIEAVGALREMKDLLSYAGQDACNEAVAQGNKNKAWHIARKFLGDGE